MSTQDVLVRYDAGKVDRAEDLNDLIGSVWADAVNDPNDQAQIAAILGLAADRLRDAPSPVGAKISKSGLTGAEVEIAFVSGFVLAIAKDTGSASGEISLKAVRKVWGVLQRRLLSREPEALGSEVASDDA
jgi:hypothetical protein